MVANSAEDIEMIPLEKRARIAKNLTHMECSVPSYKLVTEIITNIRKTTIGY